MFKHILIPLALDHDVDVEGIIETARMLQPEGGKITLVAVLETIPSYVAEFATVRPDSDVKQALKEKLLEIAADQPDLEAAVLSGKPGVAIPDLAQETDADLIVINSHRPDVQDYFLGSTASRVVRRAPCAVLVLR